MSPFRGDIIHGSVQLTWYLKHFFDALAGRAFRNKIPVEKGEQLRKTAYVLIRRAYFIPFKIQIGKPKNKQKKTRTLRFSVPGPEGNLVDIRVLWSTFPHSCCGSSVSGGAMYASMRPLSPPGAARREQGWTDAVTQVRADLEPRGLEDTCGGAGPNCKANRRRNWQISERGEKGERFC